MEKKDIGFVPKQPHIVSPRPNDHLAHAPAPTDTHHHVHHNMPPDVEDAARRGDTSAGDVYDIPITERASRANFYIAITITIIVVILLTMVIWALMG